MKKILLYLLILISVSANGQRKTGSAGQEQILYGTWKYLTHPAYAIGDSLKLVDFKLLKDTAAALRAAIGVTTMAAIGSSSNANGATISGDTLRLQPANGSFGGVVTMSAQTMGAGLKTFATGISVNNSGATAITVSAGNAGIIMSGVSTGFYVDASGSNVLIGGSYGIEARSPSVPLAVQNSASGNGLMGGIYRVRTAVTAGADGDGFDDRFNTTNSASTSVEYSNFRSILKTASATNEVGIFQMQMMDNAGATNAAGLKYTFEPKLLTLHTGQLNISTQFTPANSTDATHPNKTLTADDTYLYYRKSDGTWVKIAWTAF